jgi:peptidoglycan/xylan/chitin deacetylase (PgdA/CDA1 family)
MYRKDVNQTSPIRILEESIHGGLGKGNLGLVMARAGVGKTACLVQIALDDLLREKPVLHVSLDQTMDHVRSWYDALFEDLAIESDLDDTEGARQMVQRHRVIATFKDHDLWPDRLEKTVAMFSQHMQFRPAAILVDGYPWTSHSQSENAAMIGAFKAYAKLLGAELWMSAQTHRRATGDHPTRLVPPYDAYEELIDVAIFLEPHGHDVAVRLLKDHGDVEPSDTSLYLHPDTLRLVAERRQGDAAARAAAPARHRALQLPNTAYTLLSGGARGAEAEFGACAETWGLTELNFSFDGRAPERSRGLVNLTEDELAQGAVSQVYLTSKMHRAYPETPSFRKMLQTIWHQVSTAGQVFAVGVLQQDGTVRGGTGWAVELARHWHKPVFVYDQERRSWFAWRDTEWVQVAEPVVSERRFCGTGTRDLSDDGRRAIHELYERSFGDKPTWA